VAEVVNDILKYGFIVIPVLMNANINGKIFHMINLRNIFRQIYLLLTFGYPSFGISTFTVMDSTI
jgi:hypothetical protein